MIHHLLTIALALAIFMAAFWASVWLRGVWNKWRDQ